MSNSDKYASGVRYYTLGRAELVVPFPEDSVSCFYCSMRYKNSNDQQMCRLTGRQIFHRLTDGIREDCPLNFEEEDKTDG